VAQGASLDGTLSLKAASAAQLATWIGRPLPAPAGPDAVDATARIKAEQGRIALSGLRVALGKTVVAGSIVLEPAGARQHLGGSLQFSEFDFGQVLRRPGAPQPSLASPADAAPAATPPPHLPGAPAPATAPPPPGAPAQLPREARKTWSDDPIDTSLLKAFDADLDVSAGHLVYRDIRTGPGRLSIALKEGAAIIKLEDIELYSGRGRGMLTLAANDDALTTAANLQLDGVAIQPLLTDALRVSWLEGRGAIALTLAGKGLSERQIVETLNGTVEFSASDGAFVGLDAGKVVRSVQHARLPDLTVSPSEKTAYSELKGTFVVANGVARNRDLKLTSPQLQVTGEGTLKLAPREIDYTVRPKIIAGEPEPGAVLNIGSLEIPLSIVGPWEKPAFGIRGQEQLTNTIRKIGKNLGSPEVQEALKGLLQGGGEKRVRPRDLLDKLLKEK
jgi:AsmA protein